MPGSSKPRPALPPQALLDRALAAVADAQRKLHVARAFNAAARARADERHAEAQRSVASCRKLQKPGDQASLRPAARRN